MARSPLDVYWDTCVFISLFEQTQGRYASLVHIHDEAKAGKFKIVTSFATLAEVTRVHKNGVVDSVLSDKLMGFFENDFIAFRQLDRPTGALSHQLVRDHGLMPLDSIHLATAITAGVPVLHTYDGKKARRKGLLRLHNKIPLIASSANLQIIEPPIPPKTLLSLIDHGSDELQKADNETGDKKSEMSRTEKP